MPSVGIVVMGGLGNQMFQIAAAYAHSKLCDCTLLIKREKKENDGRSLYWDTMFVKLQPFLVTDLPDERIKWKQLGNGCQSYVPPPHPETGNLELIGYFQSSKYFKNYKKEIKNLMQPSDKVMHIINTKYSNLMEIRDRVVVVHARRGDYCKSEGMRNFHGPLDTSYYTRTIADMVSSLANPYFLFVCEDPSYWNDVIKECANINDTNSLILDDSDEVLSMGLIQQFGNFIIANSTFSWWGAWLADAKKVMAPRKWYGPTGLKDWHDIYESGWILY